MYKLLDYDITEYKQLENTLNELSKQGYNPTSLGKISRFEKNEKHYYFHVDLLIKKPATPKRKALHDFNSLLTSSSICDNSYSLPL